MNCPRCTDTGKPAALDHLDFDRRTRVDWCPDCGGVWYDKGELERVLGLDPPVSLAAAGRPSGSRIDCPCCHTPMSEVVWPKDGTVHIDACPHCDGHWLDKGELEQLRDLLNDRDDDAFPVAGQLGGEVIRVPIAIAKEAAKEAAKGARTLSPRWIVGGTICMLIIYSFTLGMFHFGELFDAMGSKPPPPDSVIAMMSGLVAFPLGGLLVGYKSEGITIWEAAIAALPVTALMALCNLDVLGGLPVAGLALAGFVLALLGAALGERLSE
ncbi:MAG: zf-TFIIB domain-containing protein [Oligoflexia bacterium]|nr:zf-TFIIB domain-containing protein [Oligoflexia bacterium]